MRIRVLVSLASLASLTLGACTSPKLANVVLGEMPAGETWPGVYRDDVLGELDLVAGSEPGTVVGMWIRTDRRYWGELSGRTESDVVHIAWTERPLECAGFRPPRTGHGYLRYAKMADGSSRLFGEIGDGADEVGARWSWAKQPGVAPSFEPLRHAIRAAGEPTLDDDVKCGATVPPIEPKGGLRPELQ